MKHLILIIFAAALAACQTEDLSEITDTVEVTYELLLPQELPTRAYSDGLSATYLTYAVYRIEANGSLTLVDKLLRSNDFNDRKTTLSLSLVKGRDYKIVFWADAGPLCPYTIDLANGTVTMDYASETTIDGNDEARDVFYATAEVEDAQQAIRASVEMHRPLAQLNFGTDDLTRPIVSNNAPAAEIDFAVELPAGLPTVFHLCNETATGATQKPITFVSKGVPLETFPVDGYSYLTMNYILPGLQADDDETATTSTVFADEPIKLTMSHAGLGNDVELSLTNVPLQRNYRTSIFGSLLTDPQHYTMEISATYDDHYCNREGVLYYCVETAEDLASAFAEGQPAIILDADVEAEGTYTLLKPTLFNLNGHSLTITSSGSTFDAPYDFIIYDGTLDITASSDSYGINLTDAACLTMYDVALSITSSSKAYGVCSTGTATITDCEITSESTDNLVYGAQSNDSNGTVNISNSTITAMGVSKGVNGFSTSGGYISIDGTKITTSQ